MLLSEFINDFTVFFGLGIIYRISKKHCSGRKVRLYVKIVRDVMWVEGPRCQAHLPKAKMHGSKVPFDPPKSQGDFVLLKIRNKSEVNFGAHIFFQ